MVKKGSDSFLEISFTHDITVTKALAKNILRKIKELADPNFNLFFDLTGIMEVSPAAKKL